MFGSIINSFFGSIFYLLLHHFSLWSCLLNSLYLPVIKTTVSFTNRHVYKWKVQRPRPAYRKAMILSFCVFNIVCYHIVLWLCCGISRTLPKVQMVLRKYARCPHTLIKHYDNKQLLIYRTLSTYVLMYTVTNCRPSAWFI